jgi:hypothetical protein
MATLIRSGIDVVSFLKQQHAQLRQLFGLVKSTSGEDCERAFYALRRLLAVHETAEEEIVHPAARRQLRDETLMDALLAQENESKKVLSQLESLGIDSSEFRTLFSRLEQGVSMHMQTEERDEFAQLGVLLNQEQLQRMRAAAAFAEKIAPTRPHAGLESAAGNLLMGPFASMLDRARDALSGKSPDSARASSP